MYPAAKFWCGLRAAGLNLALVGSLLASVPADGVRRVRLLNYPDCIELSNATTTVVLGHDVGGRVLRYAWRGKDALYLSPAEAKWQPGAATAAGAVSAGRFDIGPEYLVPKREVLWSGVWAAEVVGPRTARLTSQPDAATGVQLVREFELDPATSHLRCTQTIRNVSRERKQWCHWSRTFALHGGIGIVPLTPFSKYPRGYVMYNQAAGNGIMPQPVDPNIRQRDGFLEVLGPPAFPKLGFDTHAGWFGYQMPNDLLFVKRWATYPDKVYNEVAGITLCIWYPQANRVPAVELEPIGPRTDLGPGESASFTEHWWLLEHPFPPAGAQLDLPGLAVKVAAETR